MSSLVVRILDELDDDVLAWLNLEHLEDQAEERGRLDVPAKDSAHMVKVHCFVNQQLSCEETHLHVESCHIYDITSLMCNDLNDNPQKALNSAQHLKIKKPWIKWQKRHRKFFQP